MANRNRRPTRPRWFAGFAAHELRSTRSAQVGAWPRNCHPLSDRGASARRSLGVRGVPTWTAPGELNGLIAAAAGPLPARLLLVDRSGKLREDARLPGSGG